MGRLGVLLLASLLTVAAAQPAAAAPRPDAPDHAGPAARDRLTNGLDYYAEHPGGFVVVYLIGSCMLFDLEHTLGGDRMLVMRRRYAAAQRYGISTPEEFRAAAQAASPFWARWRAA